MALLIHGRQFYAEITVRGQRVRQSLGVEVQGVAPTSLSAMGDPAFEKSRRLALIAQEQLKADFADPIKAADRLDRLSEVITGDAKTVVKVSDLFITWLNTPRKKPLKSQQRKDEVKALVAEFTDFLGNVITDFRQIKYKHAADFVAAWPKALSPKARTNRIVNLRAVFGAAAKRVGNVKNVWAAIPLEDADTVHREPYSEDELAKILAAANRDDEIGGVVITAAATGMRREDCAMLQWTSVDLHKGLVQVRAEKNGAAVVIPILPPLQSWLERQEKKEGFCFRRAAELAKDNPDGLNVRLKNLLRSCGLDTGQIQAHNKDMRRIRKATKVGFHRFKTTFVTLALSNGVPLPLLTKIIGNSDIRVVLRHYNQPDVNALKAAMESKMPEVLTGRKTVRITTPEIRARLRSMTPDNWARVRDELLHDLEADHSAAANNLIATTRQDGGGAS
jgi:integrase